MGKADELAKRLKDMHLAATYDEALARAKDMIGEEPEESESLNELMGIEEDIEEVEEQLAGEEAEQEKIKEEDEEVKKEVEEFEKDVEHIEKDVSELEELQK